MKHLVKKGDSVVYDVKCSSSVKDVILESGGKSVMWKTGHSLIKNKMIQTNAKIINILNFWLVFTKESL